MSADSMMIKVFEGERVFFMEDGWFNETKVAKKFNKVPKIGLRLSKFKSYSLKFQMGGKSHLNKIN